MAAYPAGQRVTRSAMTIPLRDILINARQESFRMQHYYVGVEHLFIALLEIQNGLASGLLEEQGLTPEYVIDAIRRATGKGAKQRLWPGLPNSPRADIVMGIANDLAIDQGRPQALDERDLLVAVLEENDSVPARVLKKLGVDLALLHREAMMRQPNDDGRQPYVQIDFAPTFSALEVLDDDDLFILRRMFYGYDRIRIERKLTGGYSSALLLLVTPFNVDGMQDAPVVAKIDAQDLILDEAQRYEQHVRASLPPLTARLEDRPTTAETCDVAGLKYTFVGNDNSQEANVPVSARDLGLARLGDWLKHDLYPTFGKTWWQQQRPYRFQVWTEYDFMLPPILTLEYVDDESAQPTHILRDPIRRAKLHELEYGDIIAVEGFSVSRVLRDKDMIQLSIGKGTEAARRAYKINVRGMNMSQIAYYRGEPVERIVGRVWKNRDELLQAALAELFPDFDPRADMLPGVGEIHALPNPLWMYSDLLERYINGTLSKMHGDLHLGNLLVGPRETPFLIDFAEARSGHSLFDWACLEVSVLAELVMPVFGANWQTVRLAAQGIAALNRGELPSYERPEHSDAHFPISAIRDIARKGLATADKWSEYFVALGLCSLRAMTWETMAVGGRRLMLYVAALALHELSARTTRTSGDRTYFDTDVTDG